jgi:hypothetical protein
VKREADPMFRRSQIVRHIREILRDQFPLLIGVYDDARDNDVRLVLRVRQPSRIKRNYAHDAISREEMAGQAARLPPSRTFYIW